MCMMKTSKSILLFKWLNLFKSEQIVRGLIHTDGCIHNEIVFDSTSSKLIESLRYILLRMGILTSGYIRDRIGESHTARGCITHKQLNIVLRIPKTEKICELLDIEDAGQFFKFLKHDGYLYTRIKNIQQREYCGTLYDVKDVHSYMGMQHNGGGRRNGSFAIYLEPWHADIEMFLEMRKNHGDEEMKARDLFYALWIPDLFMKRVKANADWTLMCPDECRGCLTYMGMSLRDCMNLMNNKTKVA